MNLPEQPDLRLVVFDAKYLSNVGTRLHTMMWRTSRKKEGLLGPCSGFKMHFNFNAEDHVNTA